eukprot:1504240-Rhodomonas_salina.1
MAVEPNNGGGHRGYGAGDQESVAHPSGTTRYRPTGPLSGARVWCYGLKSTEVACGAMGCAVDLAGSERQSTKQ